ncbi:hypothetical protein FQZ97_728280 [compost metagenome]
MGTQVVRLRASLRFGEAEAADSLAACQGGQPAFLLLQGAILVDGPTAHGVVDAHHRSGSAVAGGDFLHGQGVGNIVDVRATPFFRHHHAE